MIQERAPPATHDKTAKSIQPGEPAFDLPKLAVAPQSTSILLGWLASAFAVCYRGGGVAWHIWKVSEQPCGRRLVAILELQLPHYQAEHEPDEPKLRKQLRALSAV